MKSYAIWTAVIALLGMGGAILMWMASVPGWGWVLAISVIVLVFALGVDPQESDLTGLDGGDLDENEMAAEGGSERT